MTEINGILYFRRLGIQWKYPDLIHGKDKDFRVMNMCRNPNNKNYGKETIIWNTDKYPQPTDTEMLNWYNENKDKLNLPHVKTRDKLNWLYHDIENDCLDKTGEFYKNNKLSRGEN